MTKEQLQRAIALWSGGRNTREIADAIGVAEPVVDAELRRFRDQRRNAKTSEGTVLRRYADKLRRCGFPAATVRLEVAKLETAQ